MSGPGPARGDHYHYYRPRDVYPNGGASHAQPGAIPPRRPVVPTVTTTTTTTTIMTNAGGMTDAAAPVSPPSERAYRLHHTRSTGSAQTRAPQRMGTISSGGKFTVSPPSSIHEEEDDGDDEEAYGYSEPAGLSPSPPRHYRDAAAAEVQGVGWGGVGEEARGELGPVLGTAGIAAQASQPGLWQTRPDASDIPYRPPEHWRGSRDMQELREARARELQSGRGPVRTSYGPAPARPPAPPLAAPPAHAPGGTTDIPPAAPSASLPLLPTPWQTNHQNQIQPHPDPHPTPQNHPQPIPQPQQPATTSPFMHYEDVTYFNTPFPATEAGSPEEEQPGPSPAGGGGGGEPKDESQIDVAVGLPAADTFPSIPEGMYSPEARRSWDRQRKRRGRRGGKGRGAGRSNIVLGVERGVGKAGVGAGTGGRWRWAVACCGGGRGGDGAKSGRACGWFAGPCGHWLPEMACCLLGVVCLGAVVAVLCKYDGRGLAEWPLAVSLNTLVAFLTAVCQVALAVPLTEGLSQLKWNSFARGERPLADFKTFEDATRGPAGSAVLLCRRKGRALGMTAATALLTSFLLSPLTQGAITYPTRSFEAGSGTATLARSESYSHPTPYAVLDAREKQAIQSGIYHPVDSEVPHLQPLCSSGDCQWPNVSSLAVCAAVADVSDRLAVSNQTRASTLVVPLGDATGEPVRRARLPNGVFLVGSPASCNLNVSWPHTTPAAAGDGENIVLAVASRSSSSGSSSSSSSQHEDSFLPTRTSLAFSDQDGRVSSAVANFFLVYTNQTGARPPDQLVFRAAEVLLHFCVNTYEASTAGGVSTSRVVHSATLAAEDVVTGTLISVRDADEASSMSGRRVLLRSAGAHGVYSVRRDDVRLLNGYVRSLFTGTYSHEYGKGIGGETPVSEALGLAMFGREPLDDEGMRAAVRNLTANVATSLTNTIRAMSSTPASGIVLATESYVRVRWAWITFLAIQVALSVSFLAGIMIQTAVWNVKILKGSPTAALFAISADDKAYLEAREEAPLDSSHRGEPSSETARRLQTTTCRFRLGERGWALSLARREDG